MSRANSAQSMYRQLLGENDIETAEEQINAAAQDNFMGYGMRGILVPGLTLTSHLPGVHVNPIVHQEPCYYYNPHESKWSIAQYGTGPLADIAYFHPATAASIFHGGDDMVPTAAESVAVSTHG